jgi:hypothetical protein
VGSCRLVSCRGGWWSVRLVPLVSTPQMLVAEAKFLIPTIVEDIEGTGALALSPPPEANLLYADAILKAIGTQRRVRARSSCRVSLQRCARPASSCCRRVHGGRRQCAADVLLRGG